jgi:hypothetical protein
MRQPAAKIKRIRAALARVNREISLNAQGGKFASGLASEGYAGGYADALNDVLLLIQGDCVPNRRDYWVHVEGGAR